MKPSTKHDLTYVGVLFTVLVLLAGLMAGLSALGLDDTTTTEVQTGETAPTTPAEDIEVPETVAESKPLAEAVKRDLGQHVTEDTVYIDDDGTIILEYTTTAASSDELETEFNRLAVAYGELLATSDHEPTTLVLVSGEVMAVVPEPAVQRYASGNLTKNALTETVEVTDVERRE